MQERAWYYLEGGTQVGPVPESQLRKVIAEGRISRETMVWGEGLPDWVTAQASGLMEPPVAAGAQPVSAGAQTGAGVALAPSEVVLLHGEEFAQKSGMLGNGNHDLPHRDEAVSCETLAHTILSAAVLSCESAGVIRLSVTPKKALLGLRTVNVLSAMPTGAANPWPVPSVENDVLSLAAKGTTSVEDICNAIIRETTNNGWDQAICVVESLLHSRGLLVREAKKALKIFTTYRYRPADGTMALAAAQPAAPIRQMLADCERGRPDVWKLLQDAIKRAVNLRTETDSGDVD